jgi:phage terminase large subunit
MNQKIVPIALYQPLEWQIEPWRDKAHTVVLAGPAGTGKTRLGLEKAHAYALKYPGATVLALRKTRESMTNSTVLFLDRVVIGRDPRVKHLQDKHRFEYANGSILAYGGMKDDEQREQIRGIGIEAGVDFCVMDEGHKFVEDDYNEITARMRGHKASWQQIMIMTNPGPPSHFINQRLIIGGEARVYDKPKPEDNPYNPPAYIEGLKRLTGILRQRLYEGKWVQAEGLVYSEFDLDNLTDEDYDPTYPVETAWDDGYVDPRVCLFIQRKPDRIIVFDEIYHRRHLAQVCVTEAKDRLKLLPMLPPDKEGDDPVPAKMEIAIIPPECKELEQRLRMADIVARHPQTKDQKSIKNGIDLVRSLILDGNGYRTLRINRRCKNTIKEVTEGYQYPEGGSRDNDMPLDKDNHSPDAFRLWAEMRGK